MSEIVELLRNTKKENELNKMQRPDVGTTRFVSIVAIVIALFVIAGTMIVSSVYLKRLYWDYVGELSNSTVYAYEHEGISIIDGEKCYVVTGDSVYLFYKKFSNGDFLEVNKKVDTAAGSLSMDFGNESRLTIWNVDKSTTSKDLLYLEYVNTKGKIYKCNVEGVTMEGIREFLETNSLQLKTCVSLL